MTWAETLHEAIGVLGLLPDVFWSLSWPDYDSLLFNHQYKQQQALVGPRMVATQVYNALQGFSKTPRFKPEKRYLPLPLFDAPDAPPPPDDFWERMKVNATRSGLRWPGQTD